MKKLKSRWDDEVWKRNYHRLAVRKYRAKLLREKRCLKCGLKLKGRLKYCRACLRKERRRNKIHRTKNWKKERERGRSKHYYYKLNAMRIVSKLERSECIKCGVPDIRVLTLHHKNGRSVKERNRKFTDYIGIVTGRVSAKGLEVRCFNCNILSEYERGRFKLPKEFGNR